MLLRAGVAAADPRRSVRPDARRPGPDRGHPDPDRRPRDLTLRRGDDLVTTSARHPRDERRHRPRPSARARRSASSRTLVGPGPRPWSATGRVSSVRARRARRALRPPDLGAPARPDQRADPHDPDPEQRRHERRGRLRGAPAGVPVAAARSGPTTRAPAGAARACRTAPPPDWDAVEHAPLPELVDVIRPGGLANQKAPRIQATLRRSARNAATTRSSSSATCPPLEARDWLTAIDGIGKKTASVLLLFSFGLPLMPVDRHVERVSHRVGLIPKKASADDAHDLFLGLLEPDQMYEAHVNLIQHGRKICHAAAPGLRRLPAPAALSLRGSRRRPDRKSGFLGLERPMLRSRHDLGRPAPSLGHVRIFGHSPSPSRVAMSTIELVGTNLRLTGHISLGRFPRLTDLINSSSGYIRVQRRTPAPAERRPRPDPVRTDGRPGRDQLHRRAGRAAA